MALTLEKFRRSYDRKETQRELYRLADLEVNGDPLYYQRLGEFVEINPIQSSRCIGLRGCSEF